MTRKTVLPTKLLALIGWIFRHGRKADQKKISSFTIDNSIMINVIVESKKN